MSSVPPLTSLSPRPLPPSYRAPRIEKLDDGNPYNLVFQQYDCSCVAACISMIIWKISGHKYLTETHARELLDNEENKANHDWNTEGVEPISAWSVLENLSNKFNCKRNFKAISNIDEKCGSSAVINVLKNLTPAQSPALVGVEYDKVWHAIVVISTGKNRLTVLDPARGVKYLINDNIDFLEYPLDSPTTATIRLVIYPD